MSFFPTGFDFRAPQPRLLRLVNLDTPDGDFGFILGQDGKFTDVNGKVWWGSTLIRSDELGFGLGGVALASSLTLSYFEDPAQPTSLVADLQSLGADYVRGRKATFYLQCFDAMQDLYAPKYAPKAFASLIMDHLSFDAPSALVRTITLHLESSFKVRGGTANLVYNTTDHARQTGSVNPSYEYIPTDPRLEKSLLS